MKLEQIGNKAWQLNNLSQNGINVPFYIVLNSEECEQILQSDEVPAAIQHRIEHVFAVSKKVSVRSSGAISMPGMMDTVLNVERSWIKAALLKVIGSWNNQRAIQYRSLMDIPSEFCGGVIIQQMIDGTDHNSGTGVAITIDPLTHQFAITGEYLENSTGDQLVSGQANPLTLDHLRETNLPVYKQLIEQVEKICQLYDKPQDIEFTYHKGEVFILQTRNFIVPPLSKREQIDEPIIGQGNRGCEGVAKGQIVFTLEQAQKTPNAILATRFTDPDDIELISNCVGVITAVGGGLSHAAMICRKLSKPCVCGMRFELKEDHLTLPDGVILNLGDEVIVNGTNATVHQKKQTTVDS